MYEWVDIPTGRRITMSWVTAIENNNVNKNYYYYLFYFGSKNRVNCLTSSIMTHYNTSFGSLHYEYR